MRSSDREPSYICPACANPIRIVPGKRTFVQVGRVKLCPKCIEDAVLGDPDTTAVIVHRAKELDGAVAKEFVG